jgi:hypothetical protein
MEYQNDVQRFNQCLITMPSPPTHTKKKQYSGTTGQINEGTEQVVHEGPSNWVKVCEINEVEYGSNLDGHLMFTLEATTIYSGGLKENPPKPQNSACSVDESFRTNALALHRWTKATLHYRLGAGAKSYLRPNHQRTHAHEPIQS